jgi:hypothetical protein
LHTSDVPADPLANRTPPDLAETVDLYRTCEFATVTQAGVPIAWPTATLYDAPSGVFTVTTSVALPTKAVNVRRNPRVSMLFSDPTGSGSSTLPQVLVRGRAVCPDVIRTDPRGLEAYWSRLYERQPAGKMYGANALTRRLTDWYYFRLVISVTPESVETRAALPETGPLPETSTADESTATGRTLAQLPHYRSAVLSWIDNDGGPRSTRVRPTAGGGDRLSMGTDASLRPGPASLLCHSHDDRLWSQRSFVTVGTLDSGDSGWTFTCERYIEGSSTHPMRVLRMFRQARATANRYLTNRNLTRPAVAWNEFAALHPQEENG